MLKLDKTSLNSMHNTPCWFFMAYFSVHAMKHLFGIIASVLHLGNIKFGVDVRGYASLNNNNKEMHWVSKVRLKLQYADGNQEEIWCCISFCCLCCAVAGDSYAGATTGLNPQED